MLGRRDHKHRQAAWGYPKNPGPGLDRRGFGPHSATAQRRASHAPFLKPSELICKKVATALVPCSTNAP